jgi:hypothetical protein
MRENPSSRQDWNNWKKFFFDRDLRIVKRSEYSYNTGPKQWEAETAEEEEMDQIELNEMKIAEVRIRAGKLLQAAKEAEKNAKTDADHAVADSLMKIANRAIDDADEDEYGAWERDYRSDKTETEEFYFDMDESDGTVRESAVDLAIGYLKDATAIPRDEKFTPGGIYYLEDDLDHDPDWEVSVEYSLEGDWTDTEEEYIWYKMMEQQKVYHMNWVLHDASKARDEADTPEKALAAEEKIKEVTKLQEELNDFRTRVPKLTYPKDVLPDKPDYIKIDDYAEHGKCVVKKEYSNKPVYEVEGDSESNLVDYDSEEISEEIQTFELEDSDEELWEQAARYIDNEGGGFDSYYNDVDDWYNTEAQPSYSDDGETEYSLKPYNWSRRELEKIWDWIQVKHGREAKFPEPADIGSEQIGDIVIDDQEELAIEQSIDALEREMISYYNSHPGSSNRYSDMATAIGKRKQYSDLLRQRDSLIRENPTIGHYMSEIESMLSGDEPIRVTGLPPSLVRDLATEKKLEKDFPEMLSMFFDAHIPGAVGFKTVKDNIVVDYPMYDYETIEALPWTHWVNWNIGGIQDEANRHWPYELMYIASVHQPGLFVMGGEKVEPYEMVVYGVPSRDDDVFAGYAPIFYDRLLRMFQYGFYKKKYPIFGLVTPILIGPGNDRASGCIGLMHKETGKRIILDSNISGPGPGFANGEQMNVTIPLHHKLDDAKFDAAVIFDLDFTASTDIGGQEVAVDQEELEVQTKIDVIEKEMMMYSKAHPGEPTSIQYVADKIGKKDEYVKLLRLRLSLMED